MAYMCSTSHNKECDGCGECLQFERCAECGILLPDHCLKGICECCEDERTEDDD